MKNRGHAAELPSSESVNAERSVPEQCHTHMHASTPSRERYSKTSFMLSLAACWSLWWSFFSSNATSCFFAFIRARCRSHHRRTVGRKSHVNGAVKTTSNVCDTTVGVQLSHIEFFCSRASMHSYWCKQQQQQQWHRRRLKNAAWHFLLQLTHRASTASRHQYIDMWGNAFLLVCTSSSRAQWLRLPYDSGHKSFNIISDE